MSNPGVDVVLRAMNPEDTTQVLAVQEPGAVVGLAKVFPQDDFPFPREAVGRRWLEEIEAHEIDCFVVEQNEVVIGFAATREDEFMHFGIAREHWGTGAAQAAHDAVLDRMRVKGIRRAWLLVFTGNERGRRFYERLGWEATGDRSRSGFPPHPELLRYELELPNGDGYLGDTLTRREEDADSPMSGSEPSARS